MQRANKFLCRWLLWPCVLAITAAEVSAQRAQWIWCQPDRVPGVAAQFERAFQLDQPATAAWLRCVGESASVEVSLNGEVITSLEPYDPLFATDVSDYLRRGTNTVVVRAKSFQGPAAFFLQLEITLGDATRYVLATDRDWSARVGGSSIMQTAVEFGEVSDKLLVPFERRVGISAVDNYEQWRQAIGAKEGTNPATFVTAPGFEIRLMHSAAPDEGSWVSLAIDAHGRIVIAKEKRGLLRMTPTQDRRSIQNVEVIDDTLLECRGLLFKSGDLFANANNSKGLYRLAADGQGGFRPPELVYASGGGVGHGRNDLALGPDGKLYAIHGDAVDLPNSVRDFTSPFREARQGHVTREGHLLRIDPADGRVEVLAAGLRNPFGIDFNSAGDMFTYDADAEYDMGAPWYRPTRVIHLVTGADYGWRGVTKQWPPYFPDHPDNALPNLDIGKGSPTAVQFGTHSAFPANYQDALFVLDWAYGRILAIHMVPRGSSYLMVGETFLKGRPLNITDIVFGPDGAMYVITGGRGTQSALYRIRYTGSLTAQPTRVTRQQRAREAFARQARALRRQLEDWLAAPPRDAQWEVVWKALGNDDPRIRYAARNVLERYFSDRLAPRMLKLADRRATLEAMLAMARSGRPDCVEPALRRLNELGWKESDQTDRGAAVYGYWLLLPRASRDSESYRDAIERLQAAYPDSSFEVNRILSEILVTHAPRESVSKTVQLLRDSVTQRDRLHYLFVLRNAREGWTFEDRRTYFAALSEAGRFLGGAGMPTFIAKIREEALATLTDSDRAALAPLLQNDATAPEEPDAPPRPFVRKWSLADAWRAIESLQRVPDLDHGAKLFADAMCVKCHRVGTRGASIGPDLTSVSNRFSRRDLLTSIIEPSKVIAEKYRSLHVITRDGKSYVGQALLTGDYRSQKLKLATDPLHPYRAVEIAKNDIVAQKKSTVSWMPEGLLDTLTADDILDLLAYIEAGGVIEAGGTSRKEPAEDCGDAVDIGSRRELFVDDLLIGEFRGTRLKMHEPHRLRHMPPRPFGHYATVLQEPDGKLRLYYRGDKQPGAHWRNGWGKYHEGEVTLYAESKDNGVHWVEPRLGLFDVPEIPKGNVVVDMGEDTFLVTHNFTPFIDGRPGVPPDERYKALGGGRYPPENWGGWKSSTERAELRKKYGPGGLKAFASADGLHWRLMQETPVIPEDFGSFDSQNGAFWSEAEQQYVCYFRWFDQGRRAIRRTTSRDFLHWTAPVNMQANEPGEHLYTSCTHPYFRAPHIYIALPTRFQAREGAITDIVLMATRPGSDHYYRHFKEAFIRPGLGQRGWGNRANYITLNVVQTSPTEMSMFMYGGAQYVLRLDGFISVHAGYETGEFVTKPLVFAGQELELNYSTSGAGEVRVEIQDGTGTPIPGFTLDDCDPIKGDTIGGVATWKSKADLSALAGKPVRLRFVMNEADIYSLRFRPRLRDGKDS